MQDKAPQQTKFHELQEHLKSLRPDNFGREFLAAVVQAVYQLMPKGCANIDQVSFALNMSPSKLRRMIQNYTALTPANYILMVRMEEALRLLNAYPKYSISTVANLCGFSDHSHFTHTFARFFGCSPMQYIQGEKRR